MKRAVASSVLVCFGVLVALQASHAWSADEFDVTASAPRAVAMDAAGRLFVLDSEAVTVVSNLAAPAPRTLVAAKANGPGKLDHPSDLTVDASGNAIVADAGNFRVAIFDRTGRFVRELPFARGYQPPQRVVAFRDGGVAVLLWDASAKGHVIKTFDPSFRPATTFEVDASCKGRDAGMVDADMVADSDGNLWFVDALGCEDVYALRTFTRAGKPLGVFRRAAGQVSLEAQRRWGNRVRIVSTLLADGDKVYVVLGAGGESTGGLGVDVWNVDGTWLRRGQLVGPARSLVRGVVRGGTAYLADLDGGRKVLRVDLKSL